MPQRNVLLTGSVPLPDAAAVMTVASQVLGGRLKRIPDGETGVRSKFITFQAPFSRLNTRTQLPSMVLSLTVRVYVPAAQAASPPRASTC